MISKNKKPGRPVSVPGRVQIPVHLTPKHVKRLAQWMKAQGIKSRSAAIRDLIDCHCRANP